MFAQINNVIIFLVAHPTKMQKDQSGLYASPTLYDVSGSSDFRNQTHDGFSIYRFFGDEINEPKTVFENLKTKMKFQGEIGGQIEYDYHLPSGRYYAKGEDVPTFCMWDPIPEIKVLEKENGPNDDIGPIIKPVSPEDAFDLYVSDDNDEIPF